MSAIAVRIDDMGSLGGRLHELCRALDIAGRATPSRTVLVDIRDRSAGVEALERLPGAFPGTNEDFAIAAARLNLAGDDSDVAACIDALVRGVERYRGEA